jgi:hypothetical protein
VRNWVGVITQNTTPTKDYKMCEWWFASAVSREDLLKRGGDFYTKEMVQTQTEGTPEVKE